MNCSLLTAAKSFPLLLGIFWIRNCLLHSFYVLGWAWLSDWGWGPAGCSGKPQHIGASVCHGMGKGLRHCHSPCSQQKEATCPELNSLVPPFHRDSSFGIVIVFRNYVTERTFQQESWSKKGRTAVSLLQSPVKQSCTQPLTHPPVCLVKGSHNKTRTCSSSNSADLYCFYSPFPSVLLVTVFQFSIFLNKHTLSNGDRLSAL